MSDFLQDNGAARRSSPSKPLGFFDGFVAVARGFRILFGTPALFLPALVPTLVLALLESAFVALALFVAKPWLAEHLPAATTWYGRVGAGVAGWALVVALAVLGWFAAVALAPPLSAPALERIVRHVESELGVAPRPALGFWRELVCGFRALAGAVLVTAPLFVLFWLIDAAFPPAAVVTLPLRLLLSALLVAWGLFDYPLTLRGFGVRRRLRLMRDHFASALGFGSAFALLFYLPCCGVVLLPVGAAAAALLVCQILENSGTA